jgi:cystathionine gamma-lyase
MGGWMRDATRVVRSGLTKAVTGEPLHGSPVFVSTFHTVGEPDDRLYSYGRSHQPTWTDLERAIGEMEVDVGQRPAGVRVFASGLAAVAAVFSSVLRRGDAVVMQQGCYFGARQLLSVMFVPQGVTVRMVAAEALGQVESLRGARLVWVETPANPGMEVADVRAVVAAAKQAGALVAVDNTTATPLGQRPLELGADFSVCSDSKAMNGHSDVLLGHVACRSEELLRKVDQVRTLHGAIAGPMEAWLLLRSLSTLPLRLERMSVSALAVAEFLSGRPEVEDVLYPGLKTNAGHAIAAGQMRHFGPVLGFTLRDKAASEAFLRNAKLVTDTTSFGGVATTAERRARWGGDAVPEGFIRMSVGLEDAQDLIDDFGKALDGI